MMMMTRAPTAPRPRRRRTRLRMVGFCAVLAAAVPPGLMPVSSADTVGDKKKLDSDIVRLRTDLEGTSQDLVEAYVGLHRTQAQLPGARQSLAAAADAQAAADRHNEAVATALAVARANAARATDALKMNARNSQEVQDRLVNMVRDDYQQGGVSGLSIALEADSPEDFTNRMIMMDTVMRVRRATLRGLGTMRAEGQAVRAHLVAVRQQVTTLKAQAEAALALANKTRVAAAAAKTKLDLLYAAQTRYAATVAAKRAIEITKLTRMQAQSDALTRVLVARAKAAREAAARAKAAREAAALAKAAREAVAREAVARERAARERAAREREAREREASEQAASEQATREQATREQAASKQAASEQAAREQGTREQGTREQAARERAAGEAAAGEANRAAAQRPPQRPPEDAPRSPQPDSETLSYPVSAPVSSEFGQRFHPILRTWRLHAGIDFAASCGSPVYAAMDGDVIMATQSGGYGNQLVIDHGFRRGVNLTTTYSHLTSFVVTGGPVARGQLVGYAGTTGLSTGCHLHLETREDGIAVNPRGWF